MLIYFESCPPISKIVSTFGIDVDGCRGLGRDLVSHQIRADKIGGQVSAGTGRSDPLDLDSIADLLADLLEACPDRLNGPAGRHQIALGEDLFVPIDHDQIGADGAHIDSEVGLFLFFPGDLEEGARASFCDQNDGAKGKEASRGSALPCVLQDIDARGARFKAPVPFSLFVFKGHQDRTDGSHGGKIFWDDELSVGEFQHLLKGLSHSEIGSHPSLEEDGFCKILSLCRRCS